MMGLRFLMQTVGLALGQIRANKVRALLTSLGIIIGVASVLAVIAALTGMRTFVLREFETIGANYMFIGATVPIEEQHRLSWTDVVLKQHEIEELVESAPSIAKLSPMWRLTTTVRNRDQTLEGVQVTGIWTDWHSVESRSVLMGRQFTQSDNEGALYVCLINEVGVTELDLARDPTGDYILLAGIRFMVVGVVETKQGQMMGQGRPRAEVYVPFTTAQKLHPYGWISFTTGQAIAPEKAEDARAEAEFILRRMRDLRPDQKSTFFVEVMQRYIEQFQSVATGVTMVAGGIVGISLLVGGVGIMNIMLVSVSERTREIGLRKAVGARPAVILAQFLVEAVTLCIFGGLIGVIVGQGLTAAMKSMPGATLEDASIPMWAIVFSIAFSAGVGLIFGMFPAIKASRLDPIEALRHE
ncbi:MAG: FtsX-like permease family protein [Phycisphaerales bacterium]|nr:MAG: FtsX-like permease family protein [Phycisphaerales bacterium]